MDDATRVENEYFENEVQRVARALWPVAEFSGSKKVDRYEIDGVFETEDCIHVIEATTSRRVQKAKEDIEKLKRVMQGRRGEHEYRAIRGWFITRDEPTADQRRVANPQRDGINVLSFSQFQSRIIDSRAYLDAREKYHFGSIRDPETGDSAPKVKYVELDLVKLGTLDNVPRDEILSLLDNGRTVVLLGDYGAGKSMTLREIYRALRRRHLKGEASEFPVYLNLRDHYGQTDPAEVIERHGRSIGFEWPTRLVRAWRAGYVHLLIDGFDEISAISIQGTWRRLRDNRYRATEIIRRLIREHASVAGLLVAGRSQFFDSDDERHSALGLSNDSVELSLSEFTDPQIKTYLTRSGLRGSVPYWLPSRPLLVGYLASKSLLYDPSDGNSEIQQLDRAKGWHTLLDRIACREAQIEAGIDGYTVRRILERLATKARAVRDDGLGPLNSESVIQAFREICGHEPEREMVLLQRLPGLGVDNIDEESRMFIDQDFADTCRAGDLVAFVESPYSFERSVLKDMGSSMDSLGIEVAAHRAKQQKFLEGKINAALSYAVKLGEYYPAADLSRLIVESGFSIRETLRLDGLFIPAFSLSVVAADFSKLEFRDCYFGRVDIEQGIDFAKMPSFIECYIHEMEGPLSLDDFPKLDDKCIVEKFTATAATTDAVLSLDLPLGVRVCLTILKKLYEQRGAGRKENALHRGLDVNARRLVVSVLQIIQAEGLVAPDRSKGDPIWRPDRSNRTRVGRLIAAPTTTADPVLMKCAELSG